MIFGRERRLTEKTVSIIAILILVICPYTCDEGCCVTQGGDHCALTTETDECCGAHSEDGSHGESVDHESDPIPQPPQSCPTKWNCICGGALKPSGDVTTDAQLASRILDRAASPGVFVASEPKPTQARRKSPPGEAEINPGRALRTRISSLLC